MEWLMIALGIAGAAAGGWSTWDQARRQKEALERQKKQAWDQYELGQANADRQYAVQSEEAMRQADVAQRRLGQGVDQSVAEMNAGLLAQAFGIQDARVGMASGIGASLAAEAAGGTRGNAANGLIRDYAAQGLERDIQAQNLQNANALNSLMTQAGNAAADIRHERESWLEGGYRWEAKQAQDEYNLGMANLGQNAFDWSMEQFNPENMVPDYLTGIFSGASSGLGLASGIGEASQYFKGNAWNSIFAKKSAGVD